MVTSAVPCVSSLWLLYATLMVTPSATTWTRESFLGVNKTAYFTRLTVRDYPGSYYRYTDSVFLCRYRLDTGELTERLLLRKTQYRDTTTHGNWTSTEMVESPLNAQKYLSGAGVECVFPMEATLARRFVPLKEGVFLQEKGHRVLVHGAERLRQKLGELRGPVSLISCYETPKHYFLLIQANTPSMDDRFTEVIIPLDRSIVDRGLIALHKAVAPPERDEPPPPVIPRKPEPKPAVYVVQPGDTLSGIALSVYGSRGEYRRIVEANPGLDPDRIRIGQKLKIPPLEESP